MTIWEQEWKYMICLISSVLHSTPTPIPPFNMDWNRLHKVSTRHGLANMLCYGLAKLDIGQNENPGIMGKFIKEHKVSLAKEAIQHFALEEIINACETHQICCLLLRGCLIKNLYPQPDMRTMADIDILIKEGQIDDVKKIMYDLGYTLKNTGTNHHTYIRKPFLNIEMHQRLVSEDSPYFEYLAGIWGKALQKKGYEYTHVLSFEDFYIYLLVHLTKHYVNGGTGIRSILDIWIYERHYNNLINWEYIWRELGRIGLEVFANNMRELSKFWFDKRNNKVGENPLLEEIGRYIFVSGTYGTQKNMAIASINRKYVKEENTRGLWKIKYWLNLFFPGLKQMSIIYPLLNHIPVLLPFTWVIRGIKSLYFRKEQTFGIIRNVGSIDEKDLNIVYDLHKRSGL